MTQAASDWQIQTRGVHYACHGEQPNTVIRGQGYKLTGDKGHQDRGIDIDTSHSAAARVTTRERREGGKLCLDDA